MRSQALQIIKKSVKGFDSEIENLVKQMHNYFHQKVENGEFFIHRQGDITEQSNLDIQTCRGILFYLMEDLPYVPREMYE